MFSVRMNICEAQRLQELVPPVNAVSEQCDPCPEIDPLEINLGLGLVELADPRKDGYLIARLQILRQEIAKRLGIVVPAIRVKDDLRLPPNQYSIRLRSVAIAASGLMPDHMRAMDPGCAKGRIAGIQTLEPAFALMLRGSQRDCGIRQNIRATRLSNPALFFTWNDDPAYHYREIDIELSRWQDPLNEGAQFVVQPWDTPGNRERYEVGSEESSTHGFTWGADAISFRSVVGDDFLDAAPANVIHQLLYTGDDIPAPGGENARMNLWLVWGEPPSDGRETEVIVSAFEFTDTTQ